MLLLQRVWVTHLTPPTPRQRRAAPTPTAPRTLAAPLSSLEGVLGSGRCLMLWQEDPSRAAARPLSPPWAELCAAAGADVAACGVLEEAGIRPFGSVMMSLMPACDLQQC
jgi:hypothetical protein